MINIPYRAAVYLGRRNRFRFAKSVSTLPPVTTAGRLPARVYSLSCENDWPEQAASIRSFLRFVGTPDQFIVVSDGHKEESRRRLERLSPCVSVISLNSLLRPDLPVCVREYAAQHFLGRKLAMLLSIPVDGPTIYTDSDILFFPGGQALARLVQDSLLAPRYLLDCWPSLDSRLLAGEHEKELPTNAGFLVLGHPLDWSDALCRLQRMQGDSAFFTEQTVVHIAMRASQGVPLAADRFILRAEDQFHFSDRYAHNDIALRHYISSIRNKFWRHRDLFS